MDTYYYRNSHLLIKYNMNRKHRNSYHQCLCNADHTYADPQNIHQYLRHCVISIIRLYFYINGNLVSYQCSGNHHQQVCSQHCRNMCMSYYYFGSFAHTPPLQSCTHLCLYYNMVANNMVALSMGTNDRGSPVQMNPSSFSW